MAAQSALILWLVLGTLLVPVVVGAVLGSVFVGAALYMWNGPAIP